jgi:subtilase family serine protease
MVSLRSLAPLLLSAAFVSPYLSAQTTSWAPTATQGVTSLVSAVDLGHANVPGLLTVRLGLKLQNKAALDSYIQSINDPANSLYGQSLTPAQFAAQYAPSAPQVQAVVTYLQSLGLTGIEVEQRGTCGGGGVPPDAGASDGNTHRTRLYGYLGRR